MTDTVNIGKTKLRISRDGCVDCGTEYASGWTVAGHVTVLVGKREALVDIYRCAECDAKAPARLF